MVARWVLSWIVVRMESVRIDGTGLPLAATEVDVDFGPIVSVRSPDLTLRIEAPDYLGLLRPRPLADKEQRDLRVSIFLESSSLLTEHTVENLGILLTKYRTASGL